MSKAQSENFKEEIFFLEAINCMVYVFIHLPVMFHINNADAEMRGEGILDFPSVITDF